MGQCRAKSKRSGERCKRYAVPGKCVCCIHGGKSTGPKEPNCQNNAITHGIYSDAIREDEKPLWDRIPLGSIDDEIRLAKLQLRRALIALAEVEEQQAKVGEILCLENPDEAIRFFLSEVKDDAEKGRTTTWKRPDYRDSVYRLLGRIGDLEVKRTALLEAKPDDTKDWSEIGRRVAEALDAADSPPGAGPADS
ncbi:MAG: HGGxSTG domain-containing protein [Acidobacteriota bacterium]